MTAYLAQILNPQQNDPSKRNEFFDEDEDKSIRDKISQRECSDHTKFPPEHCKVSLFLSVFFDGTNNNLSRDEESHGHSNVARLYRAFPKNGKNGGPPGAAWSKAAEYENFFPTYVPGVGTEFLEVGDTGKGNDRKYGLAGAYLGENRIIWALVEVINNIHLYYKKSQFIKEDEFKKTFNKLTLPDFGDTSATLDWWNDENPSFRACRNLKSAFTDALKKLHESLATFVPVGDKLKSKDRGVVTALYFSLFGFSRGAVQARVFANWFMWLCRLDAEIAGRAGHSLGTIPVTFDFMGLFDSVASVGIAASAPLVGAYGHNAWANPATSLKIPMPGPVRCLHLISGHELRRSFPLDAILHKGNLPDGCQEVVFPGVHSDIGGGYLPQEQGRGKDEEGADMVSRITLATMYRAARLAGVPLKLEDAPEAVKRSFLVDAGLIQVFNAYIQFCAKPDAPKEPVTGPLHEILAYQHKLYIQWRKKMVGKMDTLPSYIASDEHDRLDIKSADDELKVEIAQFEKWRHWTPGQDDSRQPPFSWPEWTTLATYWDEPAPPTAVTDFFDQVVHDSRAWFKPLGKDIPDLQFEMEQLIVREEAVSEWDETSQWNDTSLHSRPTPLSPEEKRRLLRYKEYRGTDNVRKGLMPESKGREKVWMGGGFLRYRKVFMGSNSYKPKGAVYARLPGGGQPQMG